MAGENVSELKETAVAYRTATDFPALHDPRYPVHRIANRLEPFVRAIVDQVHPEKIILFGSYAYGEPNEHSDVDLLVIRRNIVSEKASNLEIRHAFDSVPGPLFSFTILSKTPERIANRLAIKSPFYQDIVGKGVELYAAQ
ncbi:MAG: nucleotidyltransferase domain-containing protein [Verrucomicrobiae bacterium]|nr:nucleotidyltransferase domain-containing protein [Verrucomicrobiae bacterium]